MKDWPTNLYDQMGEWSPRHIQKLYESGFSGLVADPEAEQRFDDLAEYKTYGEACDALNLWSTRVDEGLYLPYLAVIACEAKRLGIEGSIADLSRDDRIYPWDEKQRTGDCVSHWARNHSDCVRACEIIDGGEWEEWICRTATEPIYGHRGHAGQGANCARLADYLTHDGGMMLRKVYDIPEVGKLDLTDYSPEIGINWGRSGVPQAVRVEGQKHQIRKAARITTVEEAVQAYRNGLAMGGCSDIAYSSTRNEDGVVDVQGSWAHAMFGGGLDERPETIRKYGGRLFLDINSWGEYNSGPRQIRGTDFWIPKGAGWVREKDYARRKINGGGCFVLAGANGWKLTKLPDWGMLVLTKKGW